MNGKEIIPGCVIVAMGPFIFAGGIWALAAGAGALGLGGWLEVALGLALLIFLAIVAAAAAREAARSLWRRARKQGMSMLPSLAGACAILLVAFFPWWLPAHTIHIPHAFIPGIVHWLPTAQWIAVFAASGLVFLWE